MTLRTAHGVSLDWYELTEERRAAVRAWLRDEGIDPTHLRTVRLAREGAVEVERYRLNGVGAHYYLGEADFAEVAVETVEVPVTTPPPPEWWP